MTLNYLRRYYKLDLYSACLFPVFLLYQILFSDNTKSVDVLLKKVVVVHLFTNTIMFLHHMFVIPFLVFAGDFRLLVVLLRRLLIRRVDYGSYLSSRLTGSQDAQRQSEKVEIALFILRHRLKEKVLLLVRILLYLLFLVYVLTTNNSIIYLLNYSCICVLFTSVYFGTIIHFVLFPNSDHIDAYARYLRNFNSGDGLGFKNFATGSSGLNKELSVELENKFLSNPVEDNIVMNYEHSPMLYKVFLVQLVLGIFGVCFGNYLLLLDWYQLFARFPVTSYVGIFVGHLLSSIACNLALRRTEGTDGNVRDKGDHSFRMAGMMDKREESERTNKSSGGLIDFLLR